MSWEDFVLRGIEARQQRDGGQWELGDLAIQIQTGYGESTLAKYAGAVGVEYSTLRDYKGVAEAFEIVARATNLTWRHHRALAPRRDRLEWLTRTADERWSVRQLKSAAFVAGALLH